MKRILATVFAAALLGAACSTLQVSTDYDKAVDFSQYKTFSYRDSGEIKDDIWASRIENFLTDALAAKGLKRVPNDGDLWLVAHPRLSKQTQINTYNSGWGYGYGWYGGRRDDHLHGLGDPGRNARRGPRRRQEEGSRVARRGDGYAQSRRVARSPREEAARRRRTALRRLPAREEVGFPRATT